MREKLTFFVRLQDAVNPELVSYGEVPYFHGLSPENEHQVERSLKQLAGEKDSSLFCKDTGISCVNFGLQQAVRGLRNDSRLIYPSPFTSGERSIVINGLIWMGTYKEMQARLEKKLEEGFRCIKIKIGAIDWQKELRLLRFIRSAAGPEVTVRVDANGAFSPSEALEKLDMLALFEVHSIEQPIRAGNWREMAEICRKSPVPVALDEELIGIPPGERRDELINEICPQYLVLKPALCFGFEGAMDWIKRAENAGIGWWITSALESSVGLDAIAQFTGELNVSVPQGLGTGSLYLNNFESPLILQGENLMYQGPVAPYAAGLENLPWISYDDPD